MFWVKKEVSNFDLIEDLFRLRQREIVIHSGVIWFAEIKMILDDSREHWSSLGNPKFLAPKILDFACLIEKKGQIQQELFCFGFVPNLHQP